MLYVELTKLNIIVILFFSLPFGRGGAGEGGAGPPPHLRAGSIRALYVVVSRIVTFTCRRSGRAKIVRTGRLRVRLRAASGQFTGSGRASERSERAERSGAERSDGDFWSFDFWRPGRYEGAAIIGLPT